MTKFRTSFLFILIFFIFTYLNLFREITTYFLVILLHESAHIVMALYYGYNIDSIRYNVFGAGVYVKNGNFKPKEEVIISLAGPMANLILIGLSVVSWWLFPQVYNTTILFVVANFSICVTNLIPIFPLDGGRILMGLLNKKKNILIKIMKVTTISFIVIFFALFILSFIYKLNITFLTMAIFLCVSYYDFNRSLYINSCMAINNNYNIILEQKLFYVPVNIDEKKLIKLLSPHYYAVFYFTDDRGKVVKIKTCRDLIK